MNRDTLVGIVGAVILVVAMIGVFKYEGDQSASTLGSKSYAVTWSTATANGPTAQGTTNLHAKSAAKLTVPASNLTAVDLTVMWTPTNGKDSLKITVSGPGGIGSKDFGPSDTGKVEILFDRLNEEPTPTTVFANSASEAATRLAADHVGRKGTGDWNVTVEFVDATGVQIVPGQPPIQQDPNVAWQAKSILTTYAPTFSEN